MNAPELVEHFFRHEYGRLVATLSRQIGVHRIEAVEDAAQAALMAALESWPRAGFPANANAWLYRVARNRLVGELRQHARRDRILSLQSDDARPGFAEVLDPPPSEQVDADLLRMLFVCCDESLPAESQLVLALKTLCGFDVREIAQRLFISEAHVYKRLARARTRLQSVRLPLDTLSLGRLAERRGAVQHVLYLLFTEGHWSSHAHSAIRKELCEEALRLTRLLVDHPAGRTPESCALLALIYLHAARLPAREQNDALLLLEEQDRSLWNREWIEAGIFWLAQSAQGDDFSRYHAEAAIAAEHCLAPTFAQTNWKRVCECYALLEERAPSALHRLNRAIAMAEWQNPAAGLEVLAGFEPPRWLAISYLWSAVLADLHGRCGHGELAARHREAAIAAAPSVSVRAVLLRRLATGTSAKASKVSEQAPES